MTLHDKGRWRAKARRYTAKQRQGKDVHKPEESPALQNPMRGAVGCGRTVTARLPRLRSGQVPSCPPEALGAAKREKRGNGLKPAPTRVAKCVR